MNPEELKNFVDKEKNDTNGIDQKDIQDLQKVLRNPIWYNKAKEIFQNTENLHAIADGITKFLESQNTIDKKVLEAYKNVIDYLQGFQQNDTKLTTLQNTIQSKLTIEKKDNNLISLDQAKQTYEAICKKRYNVERSNIIITKEGSQDRIDIPNILNNPQMMKGALITFIEQYQTNSAEKIDFNDSERIYKLSPEQKDLLSIHLTNIVVSNRQREKWYDNIRNTRDWIDLRVRKAIYGNLFKNNENIPPLSFQKLVAVWDQSWSSWFIAGTEVSPNTDLVQTKTVFGLWKYEYSSNNTTESLRSSDTIQWIPGRDKMNISLLTTGVDANGAKISLTVGNKTITGINIGSNKEWKNPNIIIWDTNLPEGITLRNGSFQLDANKFWGMPVHINMESLSGDEVFITTSTDGYIGERTDGFASQLDKVRADNLFDMGSSDISESGKQNFRNKFTMLNNIINQQLPNGYQQKITLGAGTSKEPIKGVDKQQELKQKISNFPKNLENAITLIATTYRKNEMWAKNLMQKISEKLTTENLKFENFQDEDNKVLAQCRLYETVIYMVKNLNADNLDKISLDIAPLTGDGKRISQFAIWGIKQIK